jgi:hypothetical protein
MDTNVSTPERLSLHRGKLLLAWQASWLGATAGVAYWSFRTSSGSIVPLLEFVFFFWFVGFLAGVELFSPRHVAPTIWSYVRWVVAVGALVGVGLVARRVVLLLA